MQCRQCTSRLCSRLPRAGRRAGSWHSPRGRWRRRGDRAPTHRDLPGAPRGPTCTPLDTGWPNASRRSGSSRVEGAAVRRLTQDHSGTSASAQHDHLPSQIDSDINRARDGRQARGDVVEGLILIPGCTQPGNTVSGNAHYLRSSSPSSSNVLAKVCTAPPVRFELIRLLWPPDIRRDGLRAPRARRRPVHAGPISSVLRALLHFDNRAPRSPKIMSVPKTKAIARRKSDHGWPRHRPCIWSTR